MSESKTLTTDILNQDSLDDKLIISEVTPQLDEVVIKGTDDKNAINSLGKVATVKALVDVSELAKQEEGIVTIKDVPLKAYDKNGNAVKVEIVPSKINVDINIDSPNKVVPIKVITKGEIGFGKALSSIDMSDNQTVVYASKNILDNLEYIPLEVDITGLKENRAYKLDLNKPTGVRSMSVNNITLKFTLDSSTSKEIKGINIDIRNLSDKYNVQGLTAGDTQIDVTAKGV